ncbi:glycosyltransferase family 2 protein [Hazenella sp. IB182357]|uniref:Glycosyltransferase family 2 protein n=1 Tax=Polycladospora coralii TaxID=2771432 RepID=A0A926N946_9BACL|nr:glycosyltransferase family 2 protein [Polycladospora coralii]MBS7530097.1 glycosyltransferase family 2 protein [Polycladospora coralii]
MSKNTGVSVIVCTNKPHMMHNIFNNYQRQDYWNKEMIIILNHNRINKRKWRKFAHQSNSHNVTVYQLPEELSLGKCLNFAIRKSRFNYLAKFDDDDYYASTYLQNSMHTLLNENAGVVGRQDFYMYIQDKQELLIRHTDNHLIGGSLLFHKKIWKKIPFEDRSTGEDDAFYSGCVANKIPMAQPTFKDFVYIRQSNNKHHTWQPDEHTLYYNTTFVTHTDSFHPYIS